MIGKGLIDSSCKIVNEVNLRLNVETTSEDTHSLNNEVEQVSYPKELYTNYICVDIIPCLSKGKHSC